MLFRKKLEHFSTFSFLLGEFSMKNIYTVACLFSYSLVKAYNKCGAS